MFIGERSEGMGVGGVWQKEPIIPEVFLDFVFDFQDEEGHAKVADFQL